MKDISTIQLTNSDTIEIVCRVTEINVCTSFGKPEFRLSYDSCHKTLFLNNKFWLI